MLLECLLLVLLTALSAAADDGITVVSKTLELEQTHSLLVQPNLEYIITFVPNAEQSEFPLRVWFRSSASDVTRPLLLTARQRTGAVTWQLPHALGSGSGSGSGLAYELERTLCPDDAVDAAPSDCGDAGDAGDAARGQVSLHVSSACAGGATLLVRAAPARGWRLERALRYSAAPTAPHVAHYAWPAEQHSLRLVVSSDDDVCATVAVQGYTCPIVQTFEEMSQSETRMTVLGSGGIYISRARFPRGFFVVTLVPERDTACRPEAEAPPDWLWDSVWHEGGGADAGLARDRARVKHLTLEIKPALTRREYWAGAAATLAVFLAFYLVFGALVLAERWPRWYRLVAPRRPDQAEPGATTELESAADAAAAPRRRRRGSTATFDSSDASDSDSADEEGAAGPGAGKADGVMPAAGGAAGAGVADGAMPAAGVGAGAADDATLAAGLTAQAGGASEPAAVAADGEARAQRPFGLPARLRVSALARRRARVLAARSRRYLHSLYTVAVFYALPVLQFVAAFQVVLNVSGSLDLCYYNFLCAHPLGALSDFNHVLSNLGYLLLGALYMLQLRRRRARRARRRAHQEEYGLPEHYGLSAALGASLMVVGLLSASYHVCPNRLNFQFDTAFMYVLAVLIMVKIYQSRHPDINARAHSTFGVLAAIIALVACGVLSGGGPLFWSTLSVLHVFTVLLLSLRIYYVGQFRLEKAHLAVAAAAAAARGARPLYTARLVALLLANAVNWAFAIYGLVEQPANIASHLLFVLLCNALLHMVFYLSMKLLHGERPRWYAWLYLGGAAAAWAPALWLFASGSSDWAATPAQSRQLNHECRVLQFYDSHDLWHLLSAVALYLTLNALLTWDDGLAAVKRTDIAVF